MIRILGLQRILEELILAKRKLGRRGRQSSSPTSIGPRVSLALARVQFPYPLFRGVVGTMSFLACGPSCETHEMEAK